MEKRALSSPASFSFLSTAIVREIFAREIRRQWWDEGYKRALVCVRAYPRGRLIPSCTEVTREETHTLDAGRRRERSCCRCCRRAESRRHERRWTRDRKSEGFVGIGGLLGRRWGKGRRTCA